MGEYYVSASPPQARARKGSLFTPDGSISILPAVTDISPDVALTLPSFWAAAKAVAEPCGFLPFRLPGKPEYERLLNLEANRSMSAQSVREAVTLSAILYGVGYAVIVPNPDTGPPTLWPVLPDCVRQTFDDADKPAYIIYRGNRPIPLRFDELMVLPGLGLDGLTGLPLYKLAAQSIGLGLAAEQFASTFFKTGNMPGGVIKHPGTLDDPGRENLRRTWSELHQGLSNAHKIAILEEGMDYQPSMLSQKDYEFTATRQLQAIEACRWVGVSPVKIWDMTHSTMNNVEQISLDHVASSLKPWFKRWEIAVQRYLFPRETVECYIDPDELLRADRKSRYDVYVQAIQNGIMNPNIVQQEEGLPLSPGGNTYLTPLNMGKQNDEGKTSDSNGSGA